MQSREFNRATFEVASSMEISGRATAEEMNRSLRTGKERSFGRIAWSINLGYLMAVGLFVALAPLAARADNDEDSRHGREDNDRGIRAEITALKAQVASLQSTVSALQDQVNSLQTSNTTLQTQLTAVQSNHALLLGPFVSIDPNPEIGVIGPNIIFSGVNIHIVSGSGRTDDNGAPTGLGNLIIGYDEDPSTIPGTIAGPGIGHPPSFPPLEPGDRGGSHNLVIGSWHRFTQAAFGGFVAGEANVISSEGASVSGGGLNKASDRGASVTGGEFNTASGFFASVTSGEFNVASGAAASVSGGHANTAAGIGTVVIGGSFITNNNVSILPQPPFP